MTKGELCKMLLRDAAEYRNSGVLKSLKRNNHMNKYKGEKVKQNVIDAILVDFINLVAMNQGLDYGLYTKDFIEEAKKLKQEGK